MWPNSIREQGHSEDFCFNWTWPSFGYVKAKSVLSRILQQFREGLVSFVTISVFDLVTMRSFLLVSWMVWVWFVRAITTETEGARTQSPSSEAPRSARGKDDQAAPDWAATWLVSPLENSRFSDETAAKATLSFSLCCFT